MYRVAREKIEAGLSRGARIMLALFAGVFGAAMILMASPETGGKRIFFYGFGAFCLLIALACATRGRARQFAGSVIGCALFFSGVAYLVAELRAGTILTTRPGDPSVHHALLFLVLIGIPGAAYAIRQRFGFRKRLEQTESADGDVAHR